MVTHVEHFVSALALALVGSVHCVGMCGGFVLATTPAGSALGWRSLGRTQLLYHAGKTTTYIALGAHVGLAGEWIMSQGAAAHRLLLLAAGCLLLVVGLQTLGFLSAAPPKPGGVIGRLGRLSIRVGSFAAAVRGPLAPLYLGLFSGFVPCPLVYAFLAAGAATGSVPQAILVMGALGLGTIPALAIVAVGGRSLSLVGRERWMRLTGAALLALAAYTCFRAFAPHACCEIS